MDYYSKSNFLSKIFACWIWNYYSDFRSNGVSACIKFSTPVQTEFAQKFARLNQVIQNQQGENSKSNFLVALIKTFWKDLLIIFSLGSGVIILEILLAFLSAEIVNYWLGETFWFEDVVVLMLTYIIAAVLTGLCCFHAYIYSMITTVNIKQVSSNLLYAKILKLSKMALQKSTKNQNIISLVTQDLEFFDLFYLNILITSSIGLIICLFIVLYLYAQIMGVVIFCIMFFLMILGAFASMFSRRFRRSIASISDKRVNLVKNVIQGIRECKLYGWESYFIDKIYELRRQECFYQRLKYIPSVFNWAMAVSLQGLLLFLLIEGQNYYDYTIDLSEMVLIANLISISLFHLLIVIANGFVVLQYVFVSSDRISTMMDIEEAEHHVERQDKIGVTLSNAWLSHNPKTNNLQDDKNDCLIKDCSIQINQGELIFFIGKNRSGKSSLLESLVNEMHLIDGRISLNGTLAIVEQHVQLFSDTIKNNILFGEEYDEEWYQTVIKATALDIDLEQMKYKDNTKAGQQGVTLSGGQRSRIALARAIYSKREIYLLDDILSAVDYKTGKHIFQNSILGLLKEKTVIIASNSQKFASHADKVFLLEEGQVIQINGLQNNEELNEPIQVDQDNELDDTKQLDEYMPLETQVKEIQCKGHIQLSQFLRFLNEFFKFSGLTLFVLVVIICSQALFVIQQFNLIWLGYQDKSTQTNWDVIEPIIWLISITIIVTVIRNEFIMYFVIECFGKVTTKAMGGLVKTRINYFYQNSIGDMINVMARDIMLIDEILGKYLPDFIQQIMLIIGILVVMSSAMWYLIVSIPIFFIFIGVLRQFFTDLTRNLRQLDIQTRIPINQQLCESVDKLVLLKSFQKVQLHQDIFHKSTLMNGNAQFTYNMLNHLFVFLGLIFGVLIQVIITIVLVVFNDNIPESESAAAISMGSVVAIFILNICRSLIETENNFVSVERCYSYADLPQEKQQAQQVLDVKYGHIQFIDVYMKYNPDLSWALAELNLDIPAGNKCGVVGRTGAGKTSLIQVLFQLCPQQSGQILIDGVNISNLSVENLRSQLSIIPQHPHIFDTDLKHNVDPMDWYSEDEIFHALKLAKLQHLLEQMPNGLQTNVISYGLSFGEKQLVCLTRVLLKRSKILVLDEATSNIDKETDDYIQQCIQQQFGNSTIIQIAHRVESLKDFDFIIELEEGSIIRTGRFIDFIN